MHDEYISDIINIILPAFIDTLFMVAISLLLSTIFGIIIGTILAVSNKDGIRPNKVLYTVISTLVNIIRSFPFLILMVSIIPFTRMIAGTSIGKTAALVPLTINATPFIARLIEGTLRSVDKSVIEAAQSIGASDSQIIYKVLFKETIPTISANITFTCVSLLGSTASAGAIGAGGLGAVALSYGYQNFKYEIMYTIVVILIIMVQFIQFTGNKMFIKLK